MTQKHLSLGIRRAMLSVRAIVGPTDGHALCESSCLWAYGDACSTWKLLSLGILRSMLFMKAVVVGHTEGYTLRESCCARNISMITIRCAHLVECHKVHVNVVTIHFSTTTMSKILLSFSTTNLSSILITLQCDTLSNISSNILN